MKPKYWGILLLIAFGAAKMPLEDALTQALRDRKLQLTAPNLSWQENFSQLAVASLGGLRGLVASISYLQSYSAFQDLNWGEVDNRMTLSTRMQPTEISYWDEASWNMSHNAASSYMRDKNLRFAIKHNLYRKYVDRGVEILHEGLSYNPGDPRLLTDLANIYGGGLARDPNPRLAAKYYLEAFQHGAPGFMERMAAYEMVKLNDSPSWAQAYEILKRHYDTNPDCRKMGSVLRDLPILEDRLNIPVSQRIHPANPYVPKIPGIPTPGSTRPRLTKP